MMRCYYFRQLLFLLVTFVGYYSYGEENPTQFTSVVYSPNGERVLAVSENGLSVFTWPEMTVVKQLDLHVSRPFHLSFSPTGRLLLICGGAPAESGEAEVLQWPLQDSASSLLPVALSDVAMQGCWVSENRIALASLDKRLSLHLLCEDEAKEGIFLLGHSRAVTCAISVQQMLVSGSVDGSLRVWDKQSGDQLRTLAIHTQPVSDIAIIDEGVNSLATIASTSEDRTIRIWQPKIGRMVRFIRLPRAAECLEWSKKLKLLIAAADDGFIYLCDPNTTNIVGRKRVAAEAGHSMAPFAMALHPNGTEGVLAIAGGGLQRVDLSTMRQLDSN